MNILFQSGMQHEKLLEQCLENLIVLPNIHITSKDTPGAKQVDSEDTNASTNALDITIIGATLSVAMV